MIVNGTLILALTSQLNQWGHHVIHCLVSAMGNLPSAFCNPADEASTLVCIPSMSTSSCADVTVAINFSKLK
jgi:hypothetical protein